MPARDPVLLDALRSRGQHARLRAEQFADQAAARALDVPQWKHHRAVGLAVGLAPLGRETDDISSRLFVPSFRNSITGSLHRLVGLERPDAQETWQDQDSITLLAHFTGRGDAGEVPRATWLVQATWNGAVAAAAALSPDAAATLGSDLERIALPMWRELARLVSALGGYGPAQLTMNIYAAPEPPPQALVKWGGLVTDPPPRPLDATLYARLPELTRLRRWVNAIDPEPNILASLDRELQRASGLPVDEPTP